MKLTQSRTVHTTIELLKEEVKTVTMQYLRDEIIGEGRYITEDGRVEHWTSYPHGSGTTTDFGEATPLQLAANSLLLMLRQQ